MVLCHSNSGGMLLCLQRSPSIDYQLHYLVIFLNFKNCLVMFLIIASSRCLDVHTSLTYVLITIISFNTNQLNVFFFCYSPYHKGYRCFSPSGRLYIVHMVNFNEQEFPYSELFSPQSSSFTCPVQQLVLHVFPLDDPSLDSTHV